MLFLIFNNIDKSIMAVEELKKSYEVIYSNRYNGPKMISPKSLFFNKIYTIIEIPFKDRKNAIQWFKEKYEV